MRKTLCLIVVASGVSIAALAQPSAPPAPKPDADPVVLSFGTTQIHQSELEGALKSVPAEYQASLVGPGRKAFAEEYVRMKMLAAEGLKNGLEKTPEVAMQIMLLRDNAIANAQLNRIEAGIRISDADLQKSYDEGKASFEQAKARHILIAFKGSPAAQPGKPELTEDQAKLKAEALRKKLIAGADFEEMAKAESDDKGSGKRGGDLGTFSRGQMVPEFEKAAFEGKVGEIGPLVRTQFGYHIIQVRERKTATLAEVKPSLEKQLREKKLRETLDAMKDQAKITYNESYFTPAPPVAAAPKVPASPTAPAAPATPPKP